MIQFRIFTAHRIQTLGAHERLLHKTALKCSCVRIVCNSKYTETILEKIRKCIKVVYDRRQERTPTGIVALSPML